MKKMIFISCIVLVSLLYMITSCSYNNAEETETAATGQMKGDAATEKKAESFVLPEGITLETRIRVPEGYERTKAEKDSFTAFLRNYSMKEDGSPVLLYNGREKGDQSAQAAVFTLPLEKEDLQQCADSVMRMYAEYFWHTGQYDKIRFHFVDGFEAVYAKWREGYRIIPEDNGTYWTKSKEYDDSYETFVKFMRMVFAYAGTLSMEEESEEIPLSDIQTGDVFLQGGSPGHVVMVVDVCQKENGGKAFLLAQGYMPAQEFHVLKNPLHEDDPWYYEEEVTDPFRTPQYTFFEGSLKRLEYDR